MKCFYGRGIRNEAAINILAHFTDNYDPHDYIKMGSRWSSSQIKNVVHDGEKVYFIGIEMTKNAITDLIKPLFEMKCPMIVIDNHRRADNEEVKSLLSEYTLSSQIKFGSLVDRVVFEMFENRILTGCEKH